MNQTDFHDYWSFLHNMYTERKKDINSCDIEFSQVVWFNFGVGRIFVDGRMQEESHPQEVWLR